MYIYIYISHLDIPIILILSTRKHNTMALSCRTESPPDVGCRSRGRIPCCVPNRGNDVP